MSQAEEVWREPWWFPPPPAADEYTIDTGVVVPVPGCSEPGCRVCSAVLSVVSTVRPGDSEYALARRRQLETYVKMLDLAERLWGAKADQRTSRAWARGRELFVGLCRPVQRETFFARGEVFEGNWRMRVQSDYLNAALAVEGNDERRHAYFHGYPLVASNSHGTWSARCVYAGGEYVLWDHLAALLLMMRTDPARLDSIAPNIGPAYD